MRQEIGKGYHRMGDGLCENDKECVISLLNKTNHHEISSFVSLIHDEKISGAPKFYRKCHLYGDFESNDNGNSVRNTDINDCCVPVINLQSDELVNKKGCAAAEQTDESRLRVELIQNPSDTSLFTFDESHGHEVSDSHAINIANHNKFDFSNKVASCDLEPLHHSGAPQINNSKLDRCSKFSHISFDIPKKKKECVLVSCPSLDSSLSNDSQSVPCPVFFQSQQFLDPSESSAYLLTSHNLIPLTPATPSSGLVSQASFDSGVLSTLSLDMSHANGNENWAKRRRTASSVSSGTSEMWQSSLDGEGSALEVVSENWHAYDDSKAVFNFRMKKSEGCESLNSCLNVSSHSGNDALEVYAQPNAHFDNKDHFISMPYKKLDLCFSRTDTVKEKHKPLKANDINHSKQAEKTVRYNLDADKYFGSNVIASQNVKREELLKERYSPEVLRKMEKYAANLVMLVLNEALSQSISLGWSIKCSGQCNQVLCREDYNKKTSSKDKKEKEIQTDDRSRFSNLGLSNCSSSLCWTPEIPFSPSHRPHSRNSKRSSLSFSHDSLISGGPFQDDSHLITGAVSHDTLTFTTVRSVDAAKSCLTCIENEIYSLPIDMVKPYQGPILQPKVIIQQPKRRHSNRPSKSLHEQDCISGATSKRKITGNKQKRIKPNHSENLKDQSEGSKASKRNVIQLINNNSRDDLDDEKVSPEAVSNEKLISEMPDPKKEKNRDFVKAESGSSEHSKVCKVGLMPFGTGKFQKRKEHLSAKGERKKGRSFSSNIRNTLFTIFSFRRNLKESCVNAKNEFIDVSSQGFHESSDGLKWGKICPLPSAPPLRTSAKNSAFTDHVSVSSVSNSTLQSSSVKQNNGGFVDTRYSNNKENIAIGNHRQSSNSISPASLLGCLGHPRTNSISDYDHQTRLASVTLSKCPSTMVTSRALPPLPSSLNDNGISLNTVKLNFTQSGKVDESCDFASNIEKVKNYGWYWGPISGEAAEKVLSNEPDGSFIVRDSSDYHYIFSLTFRLNGVTSHVRIEHDQGNFSFGGFTRFKSQTIVDFIEKAVEHSRSGRYLFFLHRRPVLGPMRVQLLHPVSRFKHVQSLQHLCRFIIVKQVRKDLIPDLPLPQRLKDYLNSPHYYSEQVEQCMSLSSALSTDEGSPSPISEHCTSPCSSAVANVGDSLQNHHRLSLTRSVCPSSAPMHVTANNLFLNLRCNFPNSTSPLDRNFRYCRSKNIRLTSSHSSLDTNTLHAAAASGSAYPISTSTLSSESTSGRFSCFKCNSQHRKCRFLSASSHSSPSSPIPFDYSPPDWLSSSDDNFKKSSVDSSLNSKKIVSPIVSSTTNHEIKSTCNNVTQQSIVIDTCNGTSNSGDFVASASESLQSVVSKSALQSNCLNACDNNHSGEKEIWPINNGSCKFKL